MRVRHLRRLHHLPVGSRITAIADVLHDGGIEEERLLGNDGDILKVGRVLEVANVDLIDDDPALGRIVKAGDEIDKGRLAAAAWANEGDDLPLRDLAVDVFERGREVTGSFRFRGSRAVGEADAGKVDLFKALRKDDRVTHIANLRRLVENLENALDPGAGLGDGVPGLGHLLNRLEEHDESHAESAEISDREGAAGDEEAPSNQQPGKREVEKQLLYRASDHPGLLALEERALELTILLSEFSQFTLLHAEGLDDPDSAEELLESICDHPELLLPLAAVT